MFALSWLIIIGPVEIHLIRKVLGSVGIPVLFFGATAVLLAASAAGDVGESLHFWTRYQQKDGAGHHRGYR